METFGDYIRQRRKGLGLTQEELGDQLGFTKGYISMIENDQNPTTGEPPRLEIDKLVRLAHIIKEPEDELIRRSWIGQSQHVPADAAQHLVTDYIRRNGSINKLVEFTPEDLDSLRRGTDLVVAGWLSQLARGDKATRN